MSTEYGPIMTVVAATIAMAVDVSGQEVDGATCYGSGSVAAAVLGTLVAVLFVGVIAFLVWKYYWKTRKGKHLVLEKDPENGDDYAFDNPCFKDAGIPQHNVSGKVAVAEPVSEKKAEGLKALWTSWSPLSGAGSKGRDKRRALDDSHTDARQMNVVSLRSHDFTGLGFNINGNMRDGIFVKDVLHRGPASESGKISSGDRIVSVRISFAHMVYEDALTILSYASPYEVELEVERGVGDISGKHTPRSLSPRTTASTTPTPGGGVTHPLFRSGSSGDLAKISSSARQRLFRTQHSDESATTGNSKPATLERPDNLAKPERTKKGNKPASQYSPSALKAQLEQSLREPNQAEMTARDETAHKNINIRIESETQKTSVDPSKNRFQKFGVRVLPLPNNGPTEAHSPKHAETSQNENNMNYERTNQNEGNKNEVKIDMEVHKDFNRQGSLTGSGIKRDKQGIPQEIPDYMMNAAVAAQKNRKNVEEEVDSGEENKKDSDSNKMSKKTKGKAPAPPPVKGTMEIGDDLDSSTATLDTTLETSMEIPSNIMDVTDSFKSPEIKARNRFSDNFTNINENMKNSKHGDPDIILTLPETEKVKIEVPVQNGYNMQKPSVISNALEKSESAHHFEYSSDSDAETDRNSVINNTIELNASDITIHQSSGTSDTEDTDNRKAASLGDLSKFEKGRKSNSGTLERAQSLDITDTGMPNMCKKRKAPNRPEDDDDGDMFNSDDYLYNNILLKSKEPRLSLALNDLTVIQKTRLKKSNEWGNLEDAIANMNDDENENENSTKITDKEHVVHSNNTELEKVHMEEIDTKETENKMIESVEVNIPEVKMIAEEVKVKVEELKKDMDDQDMYTLKEVTDTFEEKIEEIKNKANLVLETNVPESFKFELQNPEKAIDNKDDVKVISEDPKVILNVNKIILNMQNYEKPMTVEVTNIDPISNEELIDDITPDDILTTDLEGNVHYEYKNMNNVNVLEDEDLEINKTEESFVTTKEPISIENTFKTEISSIPSTTQDEIVTFNLTSSNTENVTIPEKEIFSSFILNQLEEDTKERLESCLKNTSESLISSENFLSDKPEKLTLNFTSKLYDTNISDDIKVSRHSLGSLERPKSDVLKNVNKLKELQSMIQNDPVNISTMSVLTDKIDNVLHTSESPELVEINTVNVGESTTYNHNMKINIEPDLVKSNLRNISHLKISHTSDDELYKTAIDTSLSPDLNSSRENDIEEYNSLELPVNIVPNEIIIKNGTDNITLPVSSNSTSFITAIQVTTPNNNTNISEIEVNKSDDVPVLKKLPEMKFTTSSYESGKTPEKRLSQIELLRSNFEKNSNSSSINIKSPTSPSKSKIPVAKFELKMSPERVNNSKQTGDYENDKEGSDTTSKSPVQTTTSVSKYTVKSLSPKIPNNKNISVTSIRTSSKIPSGYYNTGSHPNRPPVPPKRDNLSQDHSTFNNEESSFQQWVFNPADK